MHCDGWHTPAGTISATADHSEQAPPQLASQRKLCLSWLQRASSDTANLRTQSPPQWAPACKPRHCQCQRARSLTASTTVHVPSLPAPLPRGLLEQVVASVKAEHAVPQVELVLCLDAVHLFELAAQEVFDIVVIVILSTVGRQNLIALRVVAVTVAVAINAIVAIPVAVAVIVPVGLAHDASSDANDALRAPTLLAVRRQRRRPRAEWPSIVVRIAAVSPARGICIGVLRALTCPVTAAAAVAVVVRCTVLLRDVAPIWLLAFNARSRSSCLLLRIAECCRVQAWQLAWSLLLLLDLAHDLSDHPRQRCWCMMAAFAARFGGALPEGPAVAGAGTAVGAAAGAAAAAGADSGAAVSGADADAFAAAAAAAAAFAAFPPFGLFTVDGPGPDEPGLHGQHPCAASHREQAGRRHCMVASARRPSGLVAHAHVPFHRCTKGMAASSAARRADWCLGRQRHRHGCLQGQITHPARPSPWLCPTVTHSGAGPAAAASSSAVFSSPFFVSFVSQFARSSSRMLLQESGRVILSHATRNRAPSRRTGRANRSAA
eukprot:364788-Chlamydomonas_euryale.AAC.7